MKLISTPKVAVVAALAVAVAVAIVATATGQTPIPHTFVVGVRNNTDTPRVITSDGAIPQGMVQTECGLSHWRKLRPEASWFFHFFDCYPSSATGSFDLTYRVRLEDDPHGGARWHTGSVTIDCPRGSANSADDATSAQLTLTGSGASVTANTPLCNYPRETTDADDSSSSD